MTNSDQVSVWKLERKGKTTNENSSSLRASNERVKVIPFSKWNRKRKRDEEREEDVTNICQIPFTRWSEHTRKSYCIYIPLSRWLFIVECIRYGHVITASWEVAGGCIATRVLKNLSDALASEHVMSNEFHLNGNENSGIFLFLIILVLLFPFFFPICVLI